MNETAGISTCKKQYQYNETISVQRPQPHDGHHPGPTMPSEDSEDDTENDDPTDQDFVIPHSSEPHLITQAELNDLIRGFATYRKCKHNFLVRVSSNLLDNGTKVTAFRKSNSELVQFFSINSDLIYCNNIDVLYEAFGVDHDP